MNVVFLTHFSLRSQESNGHSSAIAVSIVVVIVIIINVILASLHVEKILFGSQHFFGLSRRFIKDRWAVQVAKVVSVKARNFYQNYVHRV